MQSWVKRKLIELDRYLAGKGSRAFEHQAALLSDLNKNVPEQGLVHIDAEEPVRKANDPNVCWRLELRLPSNRVFLCLTGSR